MEVAYILLFLVAAVMIVFALLLFFGEQPKRRFRRLRRTRPGSRLLSQVLRDIDNNQRY